METDKNLLIISSEFPPEPGGIGNHAFNIAKYLQKNDYHVTVLSDHRMLKTTVEKSFDSGLAFNVFRIPIYKNRFKMYLKRFLTIFSHTKNNSTIIASGKFSLWVVALASVFYKRNYVAVVHGSEVNFSNKLLRKTIDLSLKRFDNIIAVSNYTKSLVSYLDLKNIIVIPNGFEIEKSQKLEKTKLKGSPSLITVGTISERKGQLNVINALPTIIKKFPKVHYHMVGKPNKKDRFLKIAEKLKVRDYITFHGAVSNEEKYVLLSQSDIFVMLSQHTATGDVEGFGIAILEANSIGIPGIGANNCGIEDAILNQKSGILIENKNAKEFTDAITTIMGNYEIYSKEAIDWSKKFDWKSIIKEYIKVIQS